jgi:AmmeMemoRadiSam system protein B
MNIVAQNIRPAVMAGKFYPQNSSRLGEMVNQFLAKAPAREDLQPKAVIAPHAGYAYSGAVAGSAFRVLSEARASIQRIVLIGPSHWVDFRGIAYPRSTEFATPLGTMAVDADAINEIKGLPDVREQEFAHQYEHCLEVELPFLQLVFPKASIVPLLASETGDEQIAAVIQKLWGGPETCFVISSDLSHYHEYQVAQRLDAETAALLEKRQFLPLSSNHACGYKAIRGFLRAAQSQATTSETQTLHLQNSGDAGVDHRRVVGYGAFAFGGREPGDGVRD